MAASPVTPTAGLASVVTTGGTAVTVADPGPEGGYIVNPVTSTDQGISVAEPLYVDPTGADPTLQGNGTTFCLYPGQSWELIPGQTTPTKVNASSDGHKFSVVVNKAA